MRTCHRIIETIFSRCFCDVHRWSYSGANRLCKESSCIPALRSTSSYAYEAVCTSLEEHRDMWEPWGPEYIVRTHIHGGGGDLRFAAFFAYPLSCVFFVCSFATRFPQSSQCPDHDTFESNPTLLRTAHAMPSNKTMDSLPPLEKAPLHQHLPTSHVDAVKVSSGNRPGLVGHLMPTLYGYPLDLHHCSSSKLPPLAAKPQRTGPRNGHSHRTPAPHV